MNGDGISEGDFEYALGDDMPSGGDCSVASPCNNDPPCSNIDFTSLMIGAYNNYGSKVVVNIPADVPSGDYEAQIEFATGGSA